MSRSRNPSAACRLLGTAACAAAVLGATGAPPAAAQALPAQRIVIDKDTGRARMPEHDELAAPPAARAAAPADRSAKGALQSHPAAHLLQARPLSAQLGAKGHRVDASRLSFTVLKRGADGQLDSRCVTGEPAMLEALSAPSPGGRHDR